MPRDCGQRSLALPTGGNRRQRLCIRWALSVSLARNHTPKLVEADGLNIHEFPHKPTRTYAYDGFDAILVPISVWLMSSNEKNSSSELPNRHIIDLFLRPPEPSDQRTTETCGVQRLELPLEICKTPRKNYHSQDFISFWTIPEPSTIQSGEGSSLYPSCAIISHRIP